MMLSSAVLFLTLALQCLQGHAAPNTVGHLEKDLVRLLKKAYEYGQSDANAVLTASAYQVAVGEPVTLTCTCQSSSDGPMGYSFYQWGGLLTDANKISSNTYTLTDLPEGTFKKYTCKCWYNTYWLSDASNEVAIEVIGGTTGDQIVCEGRGPISISCPSGMTIAITRADYGRSDAATCTYYSDDVTQRPSSQWNRNCWGNDDRSSKIGGLCNGQETCEVEVNNGVLSPDPCPGIYKYADVAWDCE